MVNLRIDQRGSAAVMAIIAMVFLGIVISGLLPLATQKLRAGNSDRDALAARYAAEAGLKRAYAEFTAQSTTWNWRNQDIALGGVSLTYNATYNVNISTPPTLTNGETPPAGTYAITSTGRVGGGYQQTVTGQITVLADGRVQFPGDPAFYGFARGGGSNWSGPGGANPPPLTNPMPGNYTSYNVGTNLTINSNVTVTGGSIATSATSINNNSGLPVLTGINLTVPPIPVSLAPSSYSSAPQLSGSLPSGTHALAGTYYVGGDFNTNNKTILSATGGTGADVTIYSTGNMNISDDVITNGSTNLTLISNGSININSNVNLVGNIQLYSRNDLVISSNTSLSGADLILTGYGLFMAGRNLTVNANVNLNKAVLIAGQDLTINSNSTVVGQVMAGRNMTFNSNCTIILAPVF